MAAAKERKGCVHLNFSKALQSKLDSLASSTGKECLREELIDFYKDGSLYYC